MGKAQVGQVQVGAPKVGLSYQEEVKGHQEVQGEVKFDIKNIHCISETNWEESTGRYCTF